MKPSDEIDHLISELPSKAACFGYCVDCGEVHYLASGDSRKYAYDLMARLDSEARIDFEAEVSDPMLSTDWLQGPRGGQMFGVLECLNASKQTVILKAFSGQYNGKWQVPGWVPPTFDLAKYRRLIPEIEAKIHELSDKVKLCTSEIELAKREMDEALEVGKKPLLKGSKRRWQAAQKRVKLAKEVRRSYSRSMMFVVQDLYQLSNFKSESRSILDVFYEDRGIPTGSGDCCAPKLLQFATLNQLTPVGLSEFYLGKTNKSKSRFHGEFYKSCLNKCQPILGYMLCGLSKA